MNNHPDDPNLTAYALGELPEPQRSEVARAVAESPESEAYVRETQQLAQLLKRDFQRDLDAAEAKPLNILPLPQARSFWSDSRWGSLAVAAVLAIGAVVAAVVISDAERGDAVAGKRAPRDTIVQMELQPSPQTQGAESPLALAMSTPSQPSVALGEGAIAGEPVEIDSLGADGSSFVFRDADAPPPPARSHLASSDAVAGVVNIARPLSRAAEPQQEFQTADYGHFDENPFLPTATNPLSTFAIDVDTASYANVRRLINSRTLPPKDAVRIEEMINYFTYDYPAPAADHPFSITLDAAECPWAPEHQLVRIGLKGREIAADQRGASNLVFLLDVSGSMEPQNRLPLVKKAMRLLVDQLTDADRVAVVVYAGASGVALPSTSGNRKEEIIRALEDLRAGGSTNGAQGIELAYRIAAENFIAGGTNRVILATDGDFNVGVTSRGDLVRLAEEKAKSGVFLTVLGVGDDNLKDATMQELADRGNGNYAYLDSLSEARKVLVQQMTGTLVTIAKDVKVQVEFNPARVASYRLIGYENRMLRKEDFNNDKVDAGEIGAGHAVTALYEVVPVGGASDPAATAGVDPLKYQSSPAAANPGSPDELLTVKLRYKYPDGDSSTLVEHALRGAALPFDRAPTDFRFAAAVAEFGMILRGSPHKGKASFASVLNRAEHARGTDVAGYRAGFLELVRSAQALAH